MYISDGYTGQIAHTHVTRICMMLGVEAKKGGSISEEDLPSPALNSLIVCCVFQWYRRSVPQHILKWQMVASNTPNIHPDVCVRPRVYRHSYLIITKMLYKFEEQHLLRFKLTDTRLFDRCFRGKANSEMDDVTNVFVVSFSCCDEVSEYEGKIQCGWSIEIAPSTETPAARSLRTYPQRRLTAVPKRTTRRNTFSCWKR